MSYHVWRCSMSILTLIFVSITFTNAVPDSLFIEDDIRYGFEEYRDRCTSIGVGPNAMADGSTVTTHNNDCQECDMRITHVPAADWPPGSMRPIYDIRVAYPRYIDIPENNIHGPDYLEALVDKSIYNWTVTRPIGFIEQVPHTFAYTLGTYAIQNEKQVSIGESTCSSIFFSKPIYAPDGKASMHMETLTEIALERCSSARCAIQTMGDLASQYGFYGPEWDKSIETAQDEAGEALTISDVSETWMFHILPDHTGSSAVWVARRVPPDHITAVANQFVIGEIILADVDNYMASLNYMEEAVRTGLWNPATAATKPFHFSQVYGVNRHSTAFACTRRVWRVLTLAAPSLIPIFSPYTDGMGTFGFGVDGSQPYPFSVKPDKLLTVQDIMNMNRDQYENTLFDMTSGLDGGPFGDPMRYAPLPKWKDPVNGVSWQQYLAGIGFQRPISLWRTAYSTVTQSRKKLPDVVGAVTWIAPYAPHHSSFVPVYASAEKTPSSLNTGTQYKLDKKSNWWIHCLTGNYLCRWYKQTIGDVVVFQKSIESSLFLKQQTIESQAGLLLQSNVTAADSLQFHRSTKRGQKRNALDLQSAVSLLTEFQEEAAQDVHTQWWDFFWSMASQYRDMYKVVDQHAESFSNAYRYLVVPRSWFESVGYWGSPGTPAPDEAGPVPIHPINVPTEDTQKAYSERYPNGINSPYVYPYEGKSLSPVPSAAPSLSVDATLALPSTSPTYSPTNGSSTNLRDSSNGSASCNKSEFFVTLLIGIAIGAVFTRIVSRCFVGSHPYSPIPSS